MKAAVNERYGSPDVLAIREMPTPEPNAGEVLVKVHVTTVGRIEYSTASQFTSRYGAAL